MTLGFTTLMCRSENRRGCTARGETPLKGAAGWCRDGVAGRIRARARRARRGAQVTAAFRAAARARRGQHQKPADVLRRAFASSCPGDGRASPEDFRVTATKLGLEILVKDVLAVFDTSEHVMRDDGGRKTPSRGDDAVAADEEDEAAPRGRFRRVPPEPVPRVGRYLLSYQPWIDAALGTFPAPGAGALGIRAAAERAPERADAPGSASAARPTAGRRRRSTTRSAARRCSRRRGRTSTSRVALRPRKDA